MKLYSEGAMEKAITRQEIILGIYAKNLTQIQASRLQASIRGICGRLNKQYEQLGFHSLFDKNFGKPLRAQDQQIHRRWRGFIQRKFEKLKKAFQGLFKTTRTSNVAEKANYLQLLITDNFVFYSDLECYYFVVSTFQSKIVNP